jgi:hypothetical protein
MHKVVKDIEMYYSKQMENPGGSDPTSLDPSPIALSPAPIEFSSMVRGCGVSIMMVEEDCFVVVVVGGIGADGRVVRGGLGCGGCSPTEPKSILNMCNSSRLLYTYVRNIRVNILFFETHFQSEMESEGWSVVRNNIFTL